MLEGDEVLETTQETGYRLCSVTNNPENILERPKERVFSASWDLAVPNRLFLCCQNGKLIVVNFNQPFSESGVLCRAYQVRFRRYLQPQIMNNNDYEDYRNEKIIESHWDKMTTIPNRPDEIIFLLGISKSLYYTALPAHDLEAVHQESIPVLAAFSNAEKPVFMYGTPVMELGHHNSRITSLNISPAGHILASGDEHGFLRLIQLRMLAQTPVLNTGIVSATKTPKIFVSSNYTTSTFTTILKLHHGPIFAINWLPFVRQIPQLTANNKENITSENNERDRSSMAGAMQYCVITGSIDRAVRAFLISCLHDEPFDILPLFNLDTLSTHVLAISSIAYTNPNAAIPGSEDAVYIAAGTNLGTVHVWKLLTSKVEQMVTTKTEKRAIDAFTDDGSNLIALLQPTESPVIHLSLTVAKKHIFTQSSDESAFNSYIALAASDTRGGVFIFQSKFMRKQDMLAYKQEHAEEVLDEHDILSPAKQKPTASKDEHAAMGISLMKRRFAEQREKLQVAKLLENDDGLVEGIVSLAEEHLSNNIVVACSFLPMISAGRSKPSAAGDDQLNSYYSSRVKESLLKKLAVRREKAMQFFRAETQQGGAQNKLKVESGAEEVQLDDEDVRLSEILLLCTVDGRWQLLGDILRESRSAAVISAQALATDPALLKRKRDRERPQDTQSKAQSSTQSSSNALKALFRPMLEDQSESPGDGRSMHRRDAVEVEEEVELEEDEELLKDLRDDDFNDDFNDESESVVERPSQRVPQPTIIRASLEAGNRNTSDSNKNSDSNHNSQLRATERSAALRRSEEIEPQPRNQLPTPFTKRETSVKTVAWTVESSKQTTSSSTSTVSKKDYAARSRAQEERMQDPAYQLKASSQESIHESLAVQTRARRPIAYNMENSLAQPVMHSTKRDEQELQLLDGQLDFEENLTVSTISTTSTDRRRAATLATKSLRELLRKEKHRYQALPAAQFLDQTDVSRALQEYSSKTKHLSGESKRSLPKQVDPHWLSRKQTLAPSEEDLRVFDSATPEVSVHLHFRAQQSKRQQYNQRYGLHSSIEASDQFLPKYRMEINYESELGARDPRISAEFKQYAAEFHGDLCQELLFDSLISKI